MRYKLHWGAAHVRSVRQLTPGVREIELVPVLGVIPYSVGSHININLLVNGQPETRSYSLIGDGPVDSAYRIAVRRQKDGRGGSLAMWTLEPNSSITLSRTPRISLSCRWERRITCFSLPASE